MSATTEAPALATTFLTVEEIARQLKVSKMTVYRLCGEGEMPHVRVGKVIRVPREAFVEFLRDNFRAAHQ